MLRFRPRQTPVPSAASPPDLLAVGQAIDDLMQPGHFFVSGGLHLRWTEARAEELPWEIFRGCLVPAAQTRQRARFLSWHITEVGAEDPLLSVRLDVNAGVVHVTRGILCYVWEGYDSGGGVIESREVQRWTRELVGSAELHRFADLDELRDELTCLIWQAIVGTSKLPLHSVEAPLPAFSLGRLHYCYRPWAHDVGSPMTSWYTLLDQLDQSELSHRECARLLESLLRHAQREPPSGDYVVRDDVLDIAGRLWPTALQTLHLLRTIFNEVSLSPDTGFAENAIGLAGSLWGFRGLSELEYLDFHGELLRKIGRHLTAYDLVAFHHRGANFPDALLLDELLIGFVRGIDRVPGQFLGAGVADRLRRRALRQACLIRHHYTGHLVPDSPTSPGENARVLPFPYRRVPEEQLLEQHRRNRQLFADHPLAEMLATQARQVLRKSFHDLGDPAEQVELGMGLFIDRPLGYVKMKGEPDYTPMLAHEASSLTIAGRRLNELARLCNELSLDVPPELVDSIARELDCKTVIGIPAARLAEPARPTVALADVRRVAADFVILRTLPGGLGEMLRLFDFSAVQARFDLPMLRDGQRPRVVAMVQSARGPVLGFFDDDYQCRLECSVDDSHGFVRRAGIELPIAGLRVVGEELRIPLAI